MATLASRKLSSAQIAGANYPYMRSPLTQFLDDMVRLEVRDVEIYAAGPHLYLDDVTPSDIDAIGRELAARELHPICLTPEQVIYPINIAARESTIRQRSLRYFKKAIDVCVALECPMIFLTSGWGYVEEDPDEVWKRSAAALAEIVAYGQSRGVSSVMETLQPTESRIINSATTLKAMIDMIGSPALKPAIDTVAMAVAGKSVSDYRRLFGENIGHVHLIDGAPDGHLVWGDGKLPLGRYLAELGELGYSGHMGLEVIAFQYWGDPTAAMTRHIERIRAALA